MKYFPIFIIISLLLLTRLFFYFEDRQEYNEGESLSLEYTFRQEPKKSEFGQYFFINNLLVSLPKFPLYEYGDTVLLVGAPKLSTSEKGELLILSNPKVTEIEVKNPVLSFIKPIRQRILDSVLSLIPSKEGGLLLGILLGVRDKIEPDYYDKLRNAGVLHVIAASGQNITIIAALMLLLFERIARRKLALILTVIGIVFYSLLTGFDPPIVRASIMAIFAFGAGILGKQSNSMYILLITAFIMLFASPELISDISFILSFLSTLGIVVLNPILNNIVNLKQLNFVKEDILTTVSSQIATFPILLSFFGSYSILSFPINILVLWTVPFIMIFGGIGALLSLILPVLGQPFYFLSFPFLAYFGFIVNMFSGYALQANIDKLPLSIILGYYFVLAAFAYKFTKKEKNA